ncbi:Rv3235 family protein [Mycolicibacterium moriokaense]|uniref:Alanine, arginine and proline rich protein n=1 Tax=Mycolicibacterium moriokaense TaxID=39691 RepID=A0A318H7T3_9MYCO|nr:Rv3235 family protein [Mycolicibacterium moriokaense]PXX01482.1 hypothetical protein C8E89_12945 [Mycolicibacterium moriokaense]
MTASRIQSISSHPESLTTPIIDCEPPPVGFTACPPPSPAALHRRTARSLRSVPRPVPREPLPPRSALVFADAALRRVLEVADRRRPIAQLRPLVAPALIDTVIGLTRAPQTAVATLRRVRLRMVDGDEENQAEVFGSYTRGPRSLAIAARIELRRGRWRIVALQLG